MRQHHWLKTAIVGSAAVLLLAAASVRAQDIGLDGTFTLSPVGDLTVVLKLTLPMEKYQSLRNSVSNLYLFTRGLASARASEEVAERKADWDDAARTMTFTIRTLGAARNLGNRWELEVAKEAVFSNLDEDKKTLYFNEAAQGEGGTIRGTDRLYLPAQATQIKYDAARKTVTYVMPKPSSGGAGGFLLLPGIVIAVLGLAVFGASFIVGRKAGVPPQM